MSGYRGETKTDLKEKYNHSIDVLIKIFREDLQEIEQLRAQRNELKAEVEQLRRDRDSWRRVAERLEREKNEAIAKAQEVQP